MPRRKNANHKNNNHGSLPPLNPRDRKLNYLLVFYAILVSSIFGLVSASELNASIKILLIFIAIIIFTYFIFINHTGRRIIYHMLRRVRDIKDSE